MNKIEIWRTKAIIEPSDIIRKRTDFPERGISCFSLNLLKKTAEKYGGEQIASLITVAGRMPIYKIDFSSDKTNKIEIALIPAAVGAPACAAGFEECIAMGLNTLVFFGSCGLLTPDAHAGTIIIPTAAIRDEGTSRHYLPDNSPQEIGVDINCRMAIKSAAAGLGIDNIEGKTWTTDGVYRETPEKAARYKADGAVCVEMECAAMLAVGYYREVNVLPFFFGADSLSDGKWKPDGLKDPALHKDEKLMALALETISSFV